MVSRGILFLLLPSAVMGLTRTCMPLTARYNRRDVGYAMSESERPVAEVVLEAGLPAIACIAAGAPFFLTVYLPLLGVSRLMDAPAGAPALAATLLYAAGAALFDSSAPLFEVAMFVGSAAVCFTQAAGRPPEQLPDGSDALAAFDRRLDSAVTSRRRRRTRADGSS